MILFADIMMGLGALLMVWGTLYLLKPVPIIVKLHTLGVSDTLGAMLIVAGLVILHPERIIPLSVAFLALLMWGPMVSYIIARGAVRLIEGKEQ